MSQKRENDQNLSQQEKKSKLNSGMEGPSSQSQDFSPEYVIMPWDDNTEIFYSEPNAVGETVTKATTRWELIKLLLNENKPIFDIEMFIDVIRSYNVTYNKDGKQMKPPWKCLILRHFFSNLEDEERNEFFKENGILSRIRHLALQLRELVPKLKLLKSGSKCNITLYQAEIACLLANAFLCTFPKREADVPSINFNTLFEGGGNVAGFYSEKLKCIIHYFRRVTNKQPVGKLSFYRLYIPDYKLPRWDKTNAEICDLTVKTEGRIEEQQGYLQMDFANRYVGGGVLGRGCVQEEIRFIICPELIVARLFTECLSDNEALLVIGAERYCNYTGYSDSFEYAGDYKDSTPFDENDHRKTHLIVLDALYFQQPSDQYRESKILRELKKAYVGFKPIDYNNILPLATGNWGCGAFRGDPQLKSILQLMASSQAKRSMLYVTFGDSDLKHQMEEIYRLLKDYKINVGNLYNIIKKFNRERRKNQTIFQFIVERVENHKWPEPQTSKPPSSYSKKELPKKRESETYSPDVDEFSAAEKSAFKIRNDIDRIKKSKPIEKRLSELEMDYDNLEKKMKCHPGSSLEMESSQEDDRSLQLYPRSDNGKKIELSEEDKKLLALYSQPDDRPEKKSEQPSTSVWFENEKTKEKSGNRFTPEASSSSARSASPSLFMNSFSRRYTQEPIEESSDNSLDIFENSLEISEKICDKSEPEKKDNRRRILR